MSVEIETGYGMDIFDGPFDTVGELKDLPGLYAVLADDKGKYRLLDVGEAFSV